MSYGPGQWLLVVFVMISAIGFGLVPLFARDLLEAGMDPAAIAFYRYALTALVALPFLSLRPRNITATLMGLLAGAAMGLGWIGYVVAVERTTVAAAGVIYMTYPLFTVLFAWVLLSQIPGPRAVLAAFLVLGAAWLTITPDVLAQLSLTQLAYALAAPISFGFAITVLTGWLTRLSPMARLACVPLGACLVLAPQLMHKAPGAVVPHDDLWPLVIGIALATSLIPSFLYVVAAPRIGAVKTAMAGSFELPTMFFLGWWAFGEPLGQTQYLAGALVLLAILIVSFSAQPKGRPPAA